MRTKTVLVVDDDPAVLELLRAALEDRGYRAVTAVDGEALAAARRYQPDVILLDLVMLGVDGVQVAERLHASCETAGIPIVAMSSQDRLRALAPGLPVVVWLPKPLDLGQLYATVVRWTEEL